MSKAFGNILRVVISLSLAVVVFYFSMRHLDWSELLDQLKNVEYSWVIASMVMSLLAHYFRAYRWNILIKPIGYAPNAFRTTLSVIVGYLANLVLPRLGEVVRCGVLNRTDKVPVSSSFGTVVIDRLFDLVVLLLLIAVATLLDFDRYSTFLTDVVFGKLSLSPLFFGVAVAVLILGLVASYLIYRYTNLKEKLGGFVKMVLDGIFSFGSIDNKLGFVLSTIGIWVIYFLMSYIIVFSIDETSHLGFSAGLAIIIAGGIGMSMPVQGGIGTYHLFVSAILIPFGIEGEIGWALAILLHSSQILSMIVFGVIALAISGLIEPKNSKIENDII